MNLPTATDITYNSISLSWDAVTDVVSTGGDPIIYYYVDWFFRPCYDDDTIDCDGEPMAMGGWYEISTETSQGTTTTFAHTNSSIHHLHPNAFYFYRICGINGVGFGACSD
jgi:hypothetical protein